MSPWSRRSDPRAQAPASRARSVTIHLVVRRAGNGPTVPAATGEGIAELVETINGGNQTVPTLLFPDGSSATNPSLADVKKQLA